MHRVFNSMLHSWYWGWNSLLLYMVQSYEVWTQRAEDFDTTSIQNAKSKQPTRKKGGLISDSSLQSDLSIRVHCSSCSDVLWSLWKPFPAKRHQHHGRWETLGASWELPSDCSWMWLDMLPAFTCCREAVPLFLSLPITMDSSQCTARKSLSE